MFENGDVKDIAFHPDCFQLTIPSLSDEDFINYLIEAGKRLDNEDIPTDNRKYYDPETDSVRDV